MFNKLKFSVSNFDSLLLLVLAGVLVMRYAGQIYLSLGARILSFVAIIATLPVAVSAFRSLKERKISVDLLAAVALVFSLLAQEWESAIFINLMLASARLFSRYTEGKSRQAIKHLLKLRPQKAKVKRDGQVLEIPAEHVRHGDLVVVGLGEHIPVDGKVVEGEGSVDQSNLTGESLPVDKKAGDEVFSSTSLLSGNLILSAEKIGKDTTFEKVIGLVEYAKENKAEINGIADRFASWYISLSFLGALILFLVSKDLNLVLSVLLVVCADDIAVAVPLSFLAAIGYSAKRGVIIKGANFLEGMAHIKYLIVDKTGTLTRGRLKVENVILLNNEKEEEILKLAGMVCAFSSHPSAKSIVRYIKEKKATIGEPERFEEFGGRGAVAFYENRKIITGKLAFLKESKFEITEEQLKIINQEEEKGFNTTLVGYRNKLIGIFSLADELRPNIKETIAELKELGTKKVIMLTGDNEKIAKNISDKLGIDEFRANLLPEDKLAQLQKYLIGNKGGRTVMVGDGVNDAAVLNMADIGVAMGAIGSDAAIGSADIVLMKDDFSKLPKLVRLSKYVLRIVRQNFTIWWVVNVVGLTLVFSGLIAPTGAAAYNFITDFLPFMNLLRILRLQKNEQIDGY